MALNEIKLMEAAIALAEKSSICPSRPKTTYKANPP